MATGQASRGGPEDGTVAGRATGCAFSLCRRYRYALWRWWGEGERYALFVGLNPSTADEVRDDPTVRRCLGFARSWGYDGLCMTNIFAFRATDPKVMMAQADPVGPENDHWLQRVAAGASIVVAAWGVHGVHRDRATTVTALLPGLHALALTAAGQPRHPLYLRSNLTPQLYRVAEQRGAVKWGKMLPREIRER